MFEGVDLEDSWVFGWHFDANHHRLVFDLDASVWPGHEHYTRPLFGEYTCYKRAQLIFERVATVEGLLHVDTVKPSIDPDGSIDYGNIEGFCHAGHSVYKFGGDFGEVCVKCGDVCLEIIGCPS